jgi:hypothetical protein
MIKRVVEVPTVLTCFAYRSEYFEEMDWMLATVREHHPDWPIVVGRGPVEGFDLPTLEVESPSGKCHWTLPVSLNLDGSEDDWRKICRMKGWWISQVWHNFGDLADASRNRIVWIDADARLNGPLDIELDPEPELLAAAWDEEPEYWEYRTICGGVLLYQGVKQGVMENIIDQWSSKCVSQIQDLPPSTSPWPDSDQELLTAVLLNRPDSKDDFVLIKLDRDKYASCPTADCKLVQRGIVDHWGMYLKMQMPENRDRNWPPPEEYRRSAAIGTPVPNINWKRGDEDPPEEAG